MFEHAFAPLEEDELDEVVAVPPESKATFPPHAQSKPPNSTSPKTVARRFIAADNARAAGAERAEKRALRVAPTGGCTFFWIAASDLVRPAKSWMFARRGPSAGGAALSRRPGRRFDVHYETIGLSRGIPLTAVPPFEGVIP